MQDDHVNTSMEFVLSGVAVGMIAVASRLMTDDEEETDPISKPPSDLRGEREASGALVERDMSCTRLISTCTIRLACIY